MGELECEIASGPPGVWRDVGESLQAHRRDPALAQSRGESIPEVRSVVVRRGEAAVVAAIDRWSSPPSFIIRLIQSGREINCERHDFLAKGDPRLTDTNLQVQPGRPLWDKRQSLAAHEMTSEDDKSN